MTSQARVEANRKNARKSTGPKTEAGKARVRFNALKHGLDAATVVLPHEDAGAYRKRLKEWTEELRPSGPLGRYLTERAVRLSWQLDRADLHDTARLAKRSGLVAKERDRSRRRRAEELLLRVLGPDNPEPPQPHSGRSGKGRDRKERPDDPARWLARLKASAEGCRALLGAWDEVAARLAYEPRREGDAPPTRIVDVPFVWALVQPPRMLRLLGVRDHRLIPGPPLDPRVRRILAIQEECGDPAFLAFCRWDEARRGTGDEEELPSTGFGKDPAKPLPDEVALRHELLALAELERAAVEQLLDRHEAEAEEDEDDAPDALPDAFDDSAEGERLHRYQTNWSRSLLRTIAAVEKLRGDRDEMPEQSQPAEVKVQAGQELGSIAEGRSKLEERGENHGSHGTGRGEGIRGGNHEGHEGHEGGEREERKDHESEGVAAGDGGECGEREGGVSESPRRPGPRTGAGAPRVSVMSFVVDGP